MKKKLIYWNEEKTDNVKMKKKKKIKVHISHYSIIIYDENAMEIETHNTMSGKWNMPS